MVKQDVLSIGLACNSTHVHRWSASYTVVCTDIQPWWRCWEKEAWRVQNNNGSEAHPAGWVFIPALFDRRRESSPLWELRRWWGWRWRWYGKGGGGSFEMPVGLHSSEVCVGVTLGK